MLTCFTFRCFLSLSVHARGRGRHDHVPRLTTAVATPPASPSYEQHQAVFAMCRQTYLHWPETRDEQFSDETDCRRHLTMKAGWRDVASKVTLTEFRKDKGDIAGHGGAMSAKGFARPPVLHRQPTDRVGAAVDCLRDDLTSRICASLMLFQRSSRYRDRHQGRDAEARPHDLRLTWRQLPPVSGRTRRTSRRHARRRRRLGSGGPATLISSAG